MKHIDNFTWYNEANPNHDPNLVDMGRLMRDQKERTEALYGKGNRVIDDYISNDTFYRHMGYKNGRADYLKDFCAYYNLQPAPGASYDDRGTFCTMPLGYTGKLRDGRLVSNGELVDGDAQSVVNTQSVINVEPDVLTQIKHFFGQFINWVQSLVR